MSVTAEERTEHREGERKDGKGSVIYKKGGMKFTAPSKETGARIVKSADYVGPKFPDEARKMHYGEIEHRSIYGEASPDDASALIEEGIEFHPLPNLPEERN